MASSAGALPQTALWSLQRSPDPLAGFEGPTSKEREEKLKEGSGGKRRGNPIVK